MNAETKDCRQTADYFKALGHPARICIVKELLKGIKCVTDLQQLLTTSQPNVSQHLTGLRTAGIIDFEEEGKKRCYYLTDPDMIERILKQVSFFLSKKD